MSKHFDNKYFEQIENAGPDSNYFQEVTGYIGALFTTSKIKALDVGCGSGLFFEDLASKPNISMLGLDAQSPFTSLALNRGYERVVIVEDLNSDILPFESSRFDLIICKDVLEHLVDPFFVLKEMHRCLKPGGILLLHVPNHFPLVGRLKFLFDNRIDTFNFFGSDNRWIYPHIRFFSFENFVGEALNLGFCLKKNMSYVFPAIPWLSRISCLSVFCRWLARISPQQFSYGFTVFLRKKRNAL